MELEFLAVFCFYPMLSEIFCCPISPMQERNRTCYSSNFQTKATRVSFCWLVHFLSNCRGEKNQNDFRWVQLIPNRPGQKQYSNSSVSTSARSIACIHCLRHLSFLIR